MLELFYRFQTLYDGVVQGCGPAQTLVLNSAVSVCRGYLIEESRRKGEVEYCQFNTFIHTEDYTQNNQFKYSHK